jgi:hypothetical protein
MSARAHRHMGQGALLGGAALLALGVLACAAFAPKAAAAGWLIGFAFWSEVSVGSLLLMMIHRLTGGRWGDALRPVLAPLAATIPLLFALVIPLFVAIPQLYPWARAAGDVKADVLAAYLNTPLFVTRSLIAIAGWSVLAYALPRFLDGRGQLLGAVGLVFHCVVIGGIGFDWILSLEPPFASSSFGASVAVTQLIAALAFALVLAPEPEGDPVAGDLGGLLLAFILGITYIDFMAVLVIWYGDVPRTAAWFVLRNRFPWMALAWASFVLGSLLPIGALFASTIRASRARLRIVGGCALVGLLVYHAYLVAPPFGPLALVPALLATLAIGLAVIALAFARVRPQAERPAYGE